MKRSFTKRISYNLQTFKEDLKVLQKQITKQSVYKKSYANTYERQYKKHKKKIFDDFYEGGLYNEMSVRW